MNSENFVDDLRNARPDTRKLLDFGLNSDEAADIRSSFEAIPRPKTQLFEIPDADIADLFARHDLLNIEIGMISFREPPKAYESGWIIGQVEADYLVLDANSGELLVKDIASPDHVIWRCARDGASFLDALIPAARYLGECITTDLAGTEKQLAAFRACVSASGGEKYAQFFEMLLGVE